MTTLKIHLDILDEVRQQLFTQLLSFVEGFVLAGGTALSLQIAHRKSFDFDFFSPKQIESTLLEQISKNIQIGSIAVDNRDELTLFTKDGIKCTFLYYPFFNAFTPRKISDPGFSLFPIEDIASMKAYTIGRRGEYRDYFDLYTILKENYIDIHTLIEKSKKAYGSIFDEKIFLEQLVYFDDLLDLTIIGVNGKKLTQPEEVKSYLENVVRAYL